MGKVTAFADQVVRKSGIFSNPYFRALEDGSMSLEWFQRTQEQFYFAVRFFPRPMAGLIGRIPDPKARLDILHNLVEEHGKFQEGAFHVTTFRKFLTRLGSDVSKLDDLSLWPEVRAFNSVLTAACVLDELEVGVGCMGVIEHSFATISAKIGLAVVRRGWMRKEKLVHYALHEKIDARHAEEFFAVVEPLWRVAARRYYIQQGVRLGVYIFNRLYADLFETGR
jgi:pyrroloquinoline-quinone synthase